MTEKNYITILGLGNILLQDEGFGVHFVRWIETKYRFPEGVKIVEGGTLGYKLLEAVCGCETLLVIDVIKANDEPGSIYRFTREDIEVQELQPTSAHEVSFHDVLCKAEMIDELPNVVFFCIVPYKYTDLKMELTSLIREKFSEVERLLLQELSLHNIRPLKSTDA